MTAFGKASYERYRDFNHGVSAVTGQPLPEWDDMPVHIQSGWDASAEAVALVLAECPVDEDAPGNEPAKVIVVTEAGDGMRGPAERRYLAHEADDHRDYGILRIRRDGQVVAGYAQNTWLSFRDPSAEVPDGTARALGIAKQALSAIRAEAEKRADAEFFGVCADNALGEIFTETEA